MGIGGVREDIIFDWSILSVLLVIAADTAAVVAAADTFLTDTFTCACTSVPIVVIISSDSF